MKHVALVTLAMTALIATSASAATDDEHAAHHPASGASAPVVKDVAGKVTPSMARMNAQMKAMRDMHEKVMAATTPDERAALMADHMKTMQDGMDMMGKMKEAEQMKGKMPGDMGKRHQMMEKRMDMMESMMQMMMDRMSATSTK